MSTQMDIYQATQEALQARIAWLEKEISHQEYQARFYDQMKASCELWIDIMLKELAQHKAKKQEGKCE